MAAGGPGRACSRRPTPAVEAHNFVRRSCFQKPSCSAPAEVLPHRQHCGSGFHTLLLFSLPVCLAACLQGATGNREADSSSDEEEEEAGSSGGSEEGGEDDGEGVLRAVVLADQGVPEI